MEIRYDLVKQGKTKPQDENQLGFGKIFTDHMFVMEYDPEQGWHHACIRELQPFSVHPASPIFHYAQEIFEGQKAYRMADDEIQLFRPERNAKRLNASAERLCMPEIPVDFQLEALKRLIDVERDWVPRQPGNTLYIRPTMISAGIGLGASAASKFIYFIICSPSGNYYAGGLKPVRIRIEDSYVRAVKGGTGEAKTGGNYAGSFKATSLAQNQGFDQVLWLDGKENKYCEEVGAMNMMFVIDDKIVTAPIEGTILPGITRASVIELARDLGYTLEERRISVDELFTAQAEGRFSEAFGTGTAAVISPVGELTYRDRTIVLNHREIGPIADHLYRELTSIQRGNQTDKYGWMQQVPYFEH